MKKLTPHKLNDYKTTFEIKKGKRICNAPYTALYFTPEGYIKACCGQDNHYAFGKYPHSSIAEALKSNNRRELQKSIKKNNFNFGCHACHQNIEEGNFEAAMSTQYLKYPPKRMPRVLEFELSHYCNLDCIMCQLHTKNQHDHVYDDAFIHSLKPYLKHATASRFFGGEPFLIPMYKEIWNKIKKLNPEIQIHIQSNGMVLNDEIEHLLKEMNVFLGISLDAMHKPLYEKIRKGGNFDILMGNIEKFQAITQAQNKSINYSFCPMQINWNEIPEFVDFVNQNHGILFFNTVNTPRSLSIKRMTPSALKEIITSLSKQSIPSHGNPHSVRNEQKLGYFINSLHAFVRINAEADKKYTPLPFKDVLKHFPEKIPPQVFEILQNNLSDNQLEKPISPVIQQELHNMTTISLKKEIDTIINTNDLTKFIDFFELNKQ